MSGRDQDLQPPLRWRKATASTMGNCVEVAPLAEGVAVRDSKDPDGAVLRYTPAEWKAFLDGVRGGEFDLPVLNADAPAR